MKVEKGKIVKGEFNKTYLILIIVIVILLVFNLVLFLKKVAKPNEQEEIQAKNSQNISKKENDEKNKNTKEIPKTDDEVKKYLSTLKEGNRMEYYCGQFINCIDNEQYEKAYSLLYEEFKQNYFPTLEEFEKYAKEFYPKFFAVKYDDVERYDKMYVLRLRIVDYKASNSKEAEKVQRIVVQEYDYNNFAISFSVEKENNTGNEEAKNQENPNAQKVIIN